MQFPTTLEILLARFGGQVLIPFSDALQAVGINQQTARNQLTKNSKNPFPIPVQKRGSRLFITVSALARYVDGDVPAQKKRGARTKAERLAAQQGESK